MGFWTWSVWEGAASVGLLWVKGYGGIWDRIFGIEDLPEDRDREIQNRNVWDGILDGMIGEGGDITDTRNLLWLVRNFLGSMFSSFACG